MRAILHSLSEIDTPDKAYFIGIMAADGHIDYPYSARLNLREDDEELLLKIREWICPKATIVPIADGTKRLHLNNKKLVSNLMTHNILPNKSLVLRPPEDVPCSFVSHFVRGYFDGDGSLSYGDKMSSLQVRIVSGSFEILDYIGRVSNKHIGTCGEIYESEDKRNGSILYQICWNSHRAIGFLDWLYGGKSTLFMERKYQSYLVAKQLPYLHRHTSSCKDWSEDEDRLLREKFLNVKSATGLTELLPNRSVTAIRARALKLQLKRKK